MSYLSTNNRLSALLKAVWAILFLTFSTNVWAAEAPKPSTLSHPLAITLVCIAVFLLIAIAVLANVVSGAADMFSGKKAKEDKDKKQSTHTAGMIIFLLLSSIVSQAQNSAPASTSVGGLNTTAYWALVITIFLEIIVVIGLLLSLQKMLAKDKHKRAVMEASTDEVANKLSWWDRFNSFRPLKEEAELDLGHDYDGIRELNNRLPPWWLYGFYFTILFGAIYLWRYHVSHTAPLSGEEYQMSMAQAEKQKEAYLKTSANNIDENTVKLLTASAEIAAGKTVYTANCLPCHGQAGEGTVGPNLTDDYWLHGGSINDIFKTIKYGVIEKGMKSWKDDLSPTQIAQVSSFIKSLHGTNPPNGKEKQGELYSEGTAATATTAPADTTTKK